MSIYDPSAGFTGTPDPARLAWGQAAVADARRAAGGASLDIFPEADFAFVDPLFGNPILAESLEDVATVTRASKAWSMGWTGVNGDPAGALIEHASGKAAWSPYGLRAAPTTENLITNPRGEGSALPATPTGWSVIAGDVTVTFVDRGTQDGWPFVDVTLDGVAASSGSIVFPSAATATSGDSFTAAVGAALLSGTISAAPSLVLRDQSSVLGSVQLTGLTGRHRRWRVAAAALVGSTSAGVRLNWGAGVSFSNARIRIFTPVLTKTEYLTNPVLPPAGTPGASVKAEDSVSVPTSLGWYRHDEGTLVADFVRPALRTLVSQDLIGIVQVGPTASAGRGIEMNRSTGALQGWVRNPSGSPSGSSASASIVVPAGSRNLGAIAWNASGQVFALNGVVGAAHGADRAPALATGLQPYGASAGAQAGTRGAAPIHRIRFFPRRLTNAELIALTTPHWSV